MRIAAIFFVGLATLSSCSQPAEAENKRALIPMKESRIKMAAFAVTHAKVTMYPIPTSILGSYMDSKWSGEATIQMVISSGKTTWARYAAHVSGSKDLSGGVAVSPQQFQLLVEMLSALQPARMTADPFTVELEVGTWSDAPLLEEMELRSGPGEYVKLQERGRCGKNGKSVYLTNTHSEKVVIATVKTTWVYNGEPQQDYRDHPVSPGAESHVGCTIPGPTNQRFNYKIVGARYP